MRKAVSAFGTFHGLSQVRPWPNRMGFTRRQRIGSGVGRSAVSPHLRDARRRSWRGESRSPTEGLGRNRGSNQIRTVGVGDDGVHHVPGLGVGRG